MPALCQAEYACPRVLLGGARHVHLNRIETPDVLVQYRVAAIHRLAQRVQLVRDHAAAVQRQIGALAAPQYPPLTQVPGVHLRTAGAVGGILGPGRRFRSEAQLAAYAGAAPLEVEFGPAEALDTLLRPVLLYAALRLVPDVAAGLLAGMLVADLLIYGVAIASASLRGQASTYKHDGHS